jgi:DNA excision repair protein ERCC-2
MVDKNEILFPYDKIRKVQDKLIEMIIHSLPEKQNLIVHAPTGLGKTSASICPTISYALENDMKVLFLTSRHTQHHLAIETLKDIKKKHDVEIISSDLIGKKWMCCQAGAKDLYSNEFSEFCKKMREDKTCEFFNNIRNSNKLSVKAKNLIETLSNQISHTEQIVEKCTDDDLCPYEIALILAKKSNIIITDYYYVFHPTVSEMFLKRTDVDLSKTIVIVDEAHNLPDRVRDLATSRLTSNIIRRALSESKKYHYEETIVNLVIIQDVLNNMSQSLKNSEERLVNKEEFILKIEKEIGFDQLINDLEFIAEAVKQKQRHSYIGSIANFLENWNGPTEGFARYISQSEFNNKPQTVLSNSCLDPSVITKPVIENVYQTIMMSGTLTPTEMYRDLLGMDDAIMNTFPSPFPNENRLNLIIPKTTTKYSARSEDQFKNIAKILAEVTNAVPGNSFLFFPSYYIRDKVNLYFSSLSRKTAFLERPNLAKEEKTEFLEKFKRYKNSGAVMLGVASGSFSEGVDLPGDLLKCVVVVGLPLHVPDLETKELIAYYDKKFGKGWDYGYIFPAFNKALQSAGRCIRSENDKGVVIFLDERYQWTRYSRLFPHDYNIKVSKDYVDEIERFFGTKNFFA